MAKYKVIVPFTDLQDKDKHVYQVGDPFPRFGRAKKERLEELGSKNNIREIQLIAEVDAEQELIDEALKEADK